MMKVRKTVKSICAITLALLITGMLLYPANLNVYAAGQLNVTLVSLDGVGDDFPGFTFELYKVGTLSRETSELDPEYADLGIKIPAADAFDPSKEDGGSEWQETWMDSAAALANHIKHPAGGETTATPLETFSGITPGKSISYDGTKDDLYLLVGNTVKSGHVYYTPLPMFLWNVDDQGIDAVVKVTSHSEVLKHSLMKVWDDSNNKAGDRPKAIEVGIFYGSQLIDRVKLGGENGSWTYKWKSDEAEDTYCYIGEKDGKEFTKEFTPGASDTEWSVREFTKADQIVDSEAKAAAANLISYSPIYERTSSDSLEAFIITNQYEEEVPPEPDEPDKPTKKVKTGDEFKPILTVAVITGAAILLILMLIKRRREK